MQEPLPDASAASVARFDGNAWTAMGDGTEPSAQDLIWYDGGLVAAMLDAVRVWNGATWDVLATGLPADVGIFALAIYDGQLHAAGAFDYSGFPDMALFRFVKAMRSGDTPCSRAPR